MQTTRRGFLSSAAVAPLLISAKGSEPQRSFDPKSWTSVREQFDLAPEYVHLALFYLSSHPRVVRAAVERWRRELDRNPLVTVEQRMFISPEHHMPTKIAEAIATYIGGSAGEIALTQNTTTGLALIYQGLSLAAGDEILTTAHDHYSHHESIRLAAERAGATWRKIPLFDSYDAISHGEIVDRIRRGIRPNTRAVGITWVHSSSGLKLPLAEIAAAVAEVNRGRDEKRRVRLIVDGVHGLGVENLDVAKTGIDAFAAGLHKWILAPRGTGFVWARNDLWRELRPIVPSFTSLELYESWLGGKPPAGPAEASWFSPGGFQAYEHFFAIPAAFEFHRAIGRSRVAARLHELNGAVHEGLRKLPNVTVYTPRSDAMNAGMVCFDVKGRKAEDVVHRLHEKKILASTTPYANPFARVAFGVMNTYQEVDKTLAAIRSL